MFKLKLQQLLLQICLLAICLQTARSCRGQLLATGITGEEKELILREHNRLRQLVATGRFPGQPGAENMREIVWDDELAARAQKWAENCDFNHDPHRKIDRFTMGQNLAIIWSTAPLEPDDGDFPSRIQKWFDEVQKYSFGDAWSPKTGHYSQLVWGETSLVGCGFSEYKDTSKYNKLYVCNYGPGGNVVGYKPYEAGKPSCASYGMKPSPRYPGLCAAPDVRAVHYSYNSIETYENHNNNNNKASSTYNVQQQQIFEKTTSTATKKISSYGGYSFGTKNYGGSQAFTTEVSQQQQQFNKYRNKLEAYKPSPEEFKRAVFKHTVLRTSLDQQEDQTNDHQQQQQNPTPQPAKRGWSLLTWRG
ncbi:salivary antigen-5 isoform 2-T3 [Cochliomyia hominivorax]